MAKKLAETVPGISKQRYARTEVPFEKNVKSDVVIEITGALAEYREWLTPDDDKR